MKKRFALMAATLMALQIFAGGGYSPSLAEEPEKSIWPDQPVVEESSIWPDQPEDPEAEAPAEEAMPEQEREDNMATKGMAVFRSNGEDYTVNDPNIANEFSALTSYAAGTYVNYQGNLYKFTTDHAAGAWNSAHVSQVLLGQDVSDLKSALYNDLVFNLMNDDASGAGVGTIDLNDGSINPESGYYHSDYIEIQNATGFFVALTYNKDTNDPYQSFHRIAFYDGSKTFIPGSGINNNNYLNDLTKALVTIPSGAVYARIGFNGAETANNRLVCCGKYYPAMFAGYDSEFPDTNSFSKWINRKNSDYNIGLFENLYSEYGEGSGTGTIDYTTGKINPVSGYVHSGFILVKPFSKITAFTRKSAQLYQAYQRLAFYDENMAFISGSGINNNSHVSDLTTAVVTVPAGAVYVRIGFDIPNNSEAKPYILAGERYEIKDVTYYKTKEVVDLTHEYLLFFENMFSPFASGYGEGTIDLDYGDINPASGFVHSDYIYVNGLSKIVAYEKVNDNPVRAFHRLAFYDGDKVFIPGSGINNNAHQTDLTTAVVTVPYGAEYVRIGFNVASTFLQDAKQIVRVGNVVDPLNPYSRDLWTGKTWSAYGDSITAISNGDGLDLGWAMYVNQIHPFAYFYGRGVGSQQYAWGTAGGSATFINEETGQYNSRNNSYNKDNYEGTVPEGCVTVRGCFCSWDRITHMFPQSIKDDIDMIFVMGGTNGTYDNTDLAWVANDTTDPEWAASSYYSTYGGDYNIAHLSGGIASTIMKMQAWMPNAVIIIGTPLNGQTNVEGGRTPGTIPDEYQKSKLIEDIAKMFGCPVIDVFGTCGVNVLNSPTYITDGTHPYNDAGKKALAKAVASGLNTINPNIE